MVCVSLQLFFFFNDTATTEIYTLSLHDALPIWLDAEDRPRRGGACEAYGCRTSRGDRKSTRLNSRSRFDLVCRLLLEKKKKLLTSLYRILWIQQYQRKVVR